MDADSVPPREDELENGEIVSDDAFDEVYVPLERPTQNLPVPAKALVESDIDDNERPSSSDSDSSDGGNPSKMRKKVNMAASMRKREDKNNKRKIWCSVLEAEAVASNLTGCKLDEQHTYVSYDCPTRKPSKYDKCFKYSEPSKVSHYEGLGKRNNKRENIPGRRPFRNNGFNPSDKEAKKGSEKLIPPISESQKVSDQKLAKEMADKLNEEKHELLLKTIEVLGQRVAISLFDKTREIEKGGGLLIMNGSRRRTSGGVFFYLLKTSDELSDEQRKLIFCDDKRDTNAQKKSLARRIRKQRSAKLKESLSKDDFPTLLSRTEIAIKEYKEKKKAEESSEMENPPPSPATDGRDCSSDGEEKFSESSYDKSVATGTKRELIKYDDDFLGTCQDDMETV